MNVTLGILLIHKQFFGEIGKKRGLLGISVFMLSRVININLRELAAKYGLNSAVSRFL